MSLQNVVRIVYWGDALRNPMEQAILSNILCNGTGLFHDLTIKEHFGKTGNHMEDFLILFETETKELTEIQANITV